VRTFPRLQDLSTNAATPWERLPSVARTMKFRVTARDNRAGGGCTAEDDMVITVAGTAGPFSVTAPNTNITWGVGTTQTVTWNVASSNLAPVNCAQVRIRLSTDAGLTYPIVLAASVPNSGTASVVVPNFVSTNCRVRVEAVGNVFFDISNVNFRISAAATPTFLLSVAPIERTVCVGNSAEYSVQVDNVLTFNDTVRLSVTGVPTGATVTVQPAVVTAFPATVNVRVSNLTNAQTGTYILQMQGIAATATRTVNALLTVSPAAPANAPVLSQPADKNRDLSKVTNFAWATVPFATGYTLEISTSLLFDSNVRVVPTTASAINGLSLEFGTVYYWRVKSSNLCGDGPYSEVFSFQTEGALCAQVFNSTDVPKTIPATAATTVISNLPIAATGTIADINVSVKIDHEWTGDLTARLLAPNNSAVVLFDRPGVPADPVGCDGDDLDLVFDDEATTSYATFELSCGDAPAIQGTFQPFQPLAALRGLPLNGNWRLSVRDNESDDGGSIQTWSMSVCTSQKLPIGSLSNNRLLTVVRNTSAPIDTNLLRMVSATADNQILYTLLSLPRSGSVTRNNQTLRTGSVFTQADLAGGLIRYVHNGDTATTDQFRFQVLDGVTKAWVPDGLFRICITTPLEQSLLVPETLRCFGASNAVVTSNAAGGIPPYAYSLDGGAFQNSASFTGVAAGVHIVTVRDQKGTTAKDTVLVREPMALAVNTEVRTDSVFVVATGGSGQLAYSIDGATFSANPVFSPLPNGTYQLTVRDTNGCTVVVPFDIAVPPLSHSPFITDPIRCFGDKTGVIVAFVGGGVPPYSYSLNGGAFQSSHIFAGLGAGLYTLTVRDQRGTTSSSVNVPLSQPPAITIQPVVQLDSVFIMATGGFATLSYSLDGTTFQPDPFYARLSNGTYTVTVRDVYGCTATAGFNIAVSSLGQALAITDPIRCSGDKNGAINSYVAGGTPPYSYSLNGGAFQSSSQFTGLGSGTYTVTVRDQTGATSVSMILLADPSPVSVLAVVSSDSVAVTATGGSGALTYSIDGGVTFQSAPSFSRLWNGTYTLRVRDAYGCTASIDFTIAVPSLDQTLLVTQEIRCFGDATAVVTSYAAGGVPPYTYRLDGGNFQTNSYFEGVEAGTHTVTVSDRRGVTSTDTVLVRQPAAILVSTRVDLDSVYVIATGGSGILSYSLNGGDYQSEPYFTRLAERWHIIRVRDAYGCTVADTIVIQLPGLQVEVNKQEMWKCAGDMNNTVFAQAIGGFPPYTYSLNGGPFQSRGVFENLGTGVFTVTARDTRGGLSSGQITVQGPSPIVANIRVSRDSAIVRTSGGLGSLYHSLDSINFSMDSVFSLLPNGRYQLFVFDGAGCRKTFPFEINVAPLTATVALIAPISCFGYSDGAIEVTVAGGVPPYTYNLNGGAFGTTPRFTNIGAGTMLIGVRDARGQVIYLDTTIAQPSVLALSAMLTGDNDVALSVNGGTAPYRLFLNGAAISTGVLTDLPDGLYKIVALDSRDCADTIQVRIETIGVQNADNHWKIRAHPNPGNGHYTVELPPTATYIHLQLTDTQGRLVWTGKTGAGGGAIAIDIQAHPAGPYFLRCTDGQSAATLLILKQ
jgi:subtilisin-like proprotein convertase family protein